MALLKREKRTQFAILGIGRFGASLAEELYETGNDVMVIDNDEEKINSIADKVTHAIIGDVTNETVMEKSGVKNMDAVIICMGTNIQASILATMICKDLGVPYIVCKAHNDKHKQILEKLGADSVVVPEIDMAKKLAIKITHPSLYDIMMLTGDYSIIEINIPVKWVDKTLSELDIRKNYGVSVILVKKGESSAVSPGGDYKFEQGDIAVLGSDTDNIERFIDKLKA